MRFVALTFCAAIALAACGSGSDPVPAAAPVAPPLAGARAPAPAPTPTPTPTPSPSPSASPSPAPSTGSVLPAEKTCGQANFQADILIAVNNARRSGYACASGFKAAAPELVWNDRIFAAAAAHSQDMAINIKTLNHTGSDSSDAGTRMTRAGYAWRAWGENIAVNYANATAVVNGWLKSSSGHCENLMNPVLDEFAVACVSGTWNAGSGVVNNTPFYTMDLGRQ